MMHACLSSSVVMRNRISVLRKLISSTQQVNRLQTIGKSLTVLGLPGAIPQRRSSSFSCLPFPISVFLDLDFSGFCRNFFRVGELIDQRQRVSTQNIDNSKEARSNRKDQEFFSSYLSQGPPIRSSTIFDRCVRFLPFLQGSVCGCSSR